jgi:hypothetical protein
MQYNIYQSVGLCLSTRLVFCDVRTGTLLRRASCFRVLKHCVNCSARDRGVCSEPIEIQGGAGCACVKILFLEEQIIIRIDVSSEIRILHSPNARGRVISLPEITKKNALSTFACIKPI